MLRIVAGWRWCRQISEAEAPRQAWCTPVKTGPKDQQKGRPESQFTLRQYLFPGKPTN